MSSKGWSGQRLSCFGLGLNVSILSSNNAIRVAYIVSDEAAWTLREEKIFLPRGVWSGAGKTYSAT